MTGVQTCALPISIALQIGIRWDLRAMISVILAVFLGSCIFSTFSRVGPEATLSDVFVAYSGAVIEQGGHYRDVRETRETAKRLG